MTTSHSRASAGAATGFSGASELEIVRAALEREYDLHAELVERFQREARAAAPLAHPNVVPIYRVARAGEGGRVAYVAMKYLRGGSLAALLRRRGRLTAREIRR